MLQFVTPDHKYYFCDTILVGIVKMPWMSSGYFNSNHYSTYGIIACNYSKIVFNNG